jgi:hypothetical protein
MAQCPGVADILSTSPPVALDPLGAVRLTTSEGLVAPLAAAIAKWTRLGTPNDFAGGQLNALNGKESPKD